MSTNNVNFFQLYKDFLPDFDRTSGIERSCRSPFREDKHPSFSVNIATGLGKTLVQMKAVMQHSFMPR